VTVLQQCVIGGLPPRLRRCSDFKGLPITTGYQGFWPVCCAHYLTAEGGPVRLWWSAEADRAFGIHSGEAGIGAVLSQCSGTPPKLRPCAFFLKKLSPAKCNYDVGDRELLAVVKALKAWRHWLEGAKHTFLIWTEHSNLEDIRAARSLNPRQASWALPVLCF
jgi:hypothetical protein